jgi:hypothetical protein
MLTAAAVLYFSTALPAGASSGSTRCDRSVTVAVQAALKERGAATWLWAPPSRRRSGAGNEADLQTAARENLANLKGDLAYLQQQVHGLRARLHGELSVLALRIEDNERRTMKRRKMARRWAMAVVGVCLWLGSKGVRSMLDGTFLLPGLALVGLTLIGGRSRSCCSTCTTMPTSGNTATGITTGFG